MSRVEITVRSTMKACFLVFKTIIYYLLNLSLSSIFGAGISLALQWILINGSEGKLKEEYELQQIILKTNPTFFTEFQTTDELNSIPLTENYLDPEILESFNDDFALNFEKEAAYKCQKELEDYWSLKKNTHDKRKKNKDQFLKYEDTHEEHLEDSSSQSWKNKMYVYKSEKDVLEQRKNLVSRSEKIDSVSNSNNKANQGAQTKISRVIDMFGGWGSNSSHIGNSKSFQEQDDNLESRSVSDFDEVSKNEETILKDLKVPKNISVENNKLDKNSPKYSNTKNSAIKKNDIAMNTNDCVVSSKKSFSDNNVDKQCPRQVSVPKLDSAFSKAVESSSKRNAKEIFDSLENEKCSYKKEPNTLAYNEDVMSSIVQDYTDLSLMSSDLFTKETVPIYEQTEEVFNFVSKDSISKQKHNFMHKNVSDNFQKFSKNALPTNDLFMNEKVSSDLNQPNMNQDILANEIAKNNSAYSLSNVPESTKMNFSKTTQHISQKENVPAASPGNTISFDQDKERLLINQTASFSNFAAEALPNSRVNASFSDSLPSNSNQMKDNYPTSFLNDSITTNAESNFIDPPIPAPVQPEPCQPDATKSNLMNPNFMMNMNPQIMHQMMLLSNSFFVQQLQQMNMYYKTGGLPVLSGPPVPPHVNAQYPPFFNNPLGNIPADTHVHNANFMPQQDSRYSPPISLHERFDPRSQNYSSEIFEGSSNHAKPTTVKFEESWLSDIMSEGAAYADMDSYIPPPKMPEVTSTATPHLSTIEENKIGLQFSQSYPQSVDEDGSTIRPYNCGIKNPQSRSKAVDYNQSQKRDDKNDGWDVLDKNEEAGISDEFLPTGWGNIENESSNKYSPWDEDIDGWGCTTSQPMWNSTRYESEKSTAIRQPSRQPLAKTYYRQGKF
ncbi:UNVERIFIED_CONTAM: hypothetical protein NCL1_15089 [Trichonephila clavipes]